MLKEKQEEVAAFLEKNGIPVEIQSAGGGLSIYAKAGKTPIARFVPAGKGKQGDLVEVMRYSHRDKWDPIGDFDGATMPLHEALAYVVSDAPGCFGIDFLGLKRKRI